ENGTIARRIARVIYEKIGYRFIYKNTETSQTSGSIKTFVFFCAQLKGQETKQHLVEDPENRRSTLKMDRFDCNGWLRIKMTDGDNSTARIHFRHHQCHKCYLQISLGVSERNLVGQMKNLPPSKIWDEILRQFPDTELTERQVHREW
ncbi:hypothetical protein C8J56DRAFT_1126211, partial [Mycena floridula]